MNTIEYMLLAAISFAASNAPPKTSAKFLCVAIGIYFIVRSALALLKWLEKQP